MKHLKMKLIPFLLAAMLVLASCTNGEAPPTPTATQEIDPIAIVLTATAAVTTPDMPETPAVVETPVPAVQPLDADVIFWADEAADPQTFALLDQQLKEYTAAQQLSYVSTGGLAVEQLTPKVKIVITSKSAADVMAIANAAPAVQFVSMGQDGAQPGGNLHVFSAVPATLEQRTFVAGYLLALTTPDYRVGVLYQAGTPEGAKTRGGFFTGAQYMCGICNSKFAPVKFYPVSAEIVDKANWQTAADLLLGETVTGVYVQPEISSPELINYLIGRGVRLIGVEGQDGLVAGAPGWVAVIDTSPYKDLDLALSRLLKSEAIGQVSSGLSLSAIDENVLTEGKMGWFATVETALMAGEIRPMPFGQ